jgi:hypothetical protein
VSSSLSTRRNRFAPALRDATAHLTLARAAAASQTHPRALSRPRRNAALRGWHPPIHHGAIGARAMCCFSVTRALGFAWLFQRNVHVSRTNILARMIEPGRQALTYGMN